MTDNIPQLIQPAEAVSLSDKLVTTGSIFAARDIYNAFMESEAQEQDTRWSFACALALVFEAGRIQGMRELRQAAKAK